MQFLYVKAGEHGAKAAMRKWSSSILLPYNVNQTLQEGAEFAHSRSAYCLLDPD